MNTTYSSLLETPEWSQKRKRILKRDQGKCQNCGLTFSLQVHHKQYHINSYTGEFVAPWQYQDHYLITLCDKCHQNGHKHYKVPVFNI